MNNKITEQELHFIKNAPTEYKAKKRYDMVMKRINEEYLLKFNSLTRKYDMKKWYREYKIERNKALDVLWAWRIGGE